MFDPRTRAPVRAGLLICAFAAINFVAGTVEDTMTVDMSSAESIGAFVSSQSEVTQTLHGGSAVVGASYPVRLFSLLFRPLFLDAGGAMGLIASFENAAILAIIIMILANLTTSKLLIRQIFFARFSLVYFLAITMLLALVYYNVGLGLRQKMMMMPALLAFFAALVAVRRANSARPQVLSYA
jgi:hypothetical protein